MHIRRRPNRLDQCIVHQFLDHHSRSEDATPEVPSPSRRTPSGRSSAALAELETACRGPDLAREKAVERGLTVDFPQANGSRCRAVVDPGCLDGKVGQTDQLTWAREMTKTASELDLVQQEEVRSRMLSKRQLSDMAWGVRELSRRLSSMRIRVRVKTIFLLAKIYDQELVPKTRELARWLLDADRETAYVVYVQGELRHNKRFDEARLLDELAARHAAVQGGAYAGDAAAARDALQRRIRYWDEEMCRSRPHMFDFVITLGGDGTVLYASWLFQRIVPPVLSFSLGSLGFLTKFDFDQYERTLDTALRKGVSVSLRLRFESTVMRSIEKKAGRPEAAAPSSEGEEEGLVQRDLVEELIGVEAEDAHTHRPDGTFEILNEVVVDRGPNPTMSYTELFGDDEHFSSVLADGICVSTPTGSTAYNLAAGGSLCHPENPVMLVTSICAHTLSFRPIILPDTIVLRVGVPYDARTASWVSFDGRERVELRPGDYVTISASRYPFASVQTEGRRSEDWVNSIRAKLGWNSRQKPKQFYSWDS